MKTPTTPSGNLNREKVPATPQQGTRGSKDNSEVATLREGSLPKVEKVLDAKEVKGACIDAVKKQCGPEDDTRRTGQKQSRRLRQHLIKV
jgi:hypothetical protein